MRLVWEQKEQSIADEGYKLVVQEQWGVTEAWCNKFIYGDNRIILPILLSESWQQKLQAIGGVKLIYIDPPFFAGKDFAQEEELAYSDKHTLDQYLSLMYQMLKLMHRLLAEEGSFYLHCDWHANAYLRLLLDEIFGREQFQNQICWAYRTQGASKKRFSRKHDTLFFYTKSQRWNFYPQYERSYMQHKYGFAREDFKLDEQGRQYRDALLRDVWEISALQSATSEKIGYPTQKPESLLQRILECSSQPGDLVADFCCGSGTTLAVAHRLGRPWIGCDLSPLATATTRQRLQQLQPPPVWEMLTPVAEHGTI